MFGVDIWIVWVMRVKPIREEEIDGSGPIITGLLRCSNRRQPATDQQRERQRDDNYTMIHLHHGRHPLARLVSLPVEHSDRTWHTAIYLDGPTSLHPHQPSYAAGLWRSRVGATTPTAGRTTWRHGRSAARPGVGMAAVVAMSGVMAQRKPVCERLVSGLAFVRALGRYPVQ